MRTRRVADRETWQQEARSWCKLHLGVNADNGQIVAAELTTSDVEDGSHLGFLLDQIEGPMLA